MEKLIVRPAPFIKSKNSATRLMEHKILMLTVLVVVGVIFTGYKSGIILAVSLLSALIFELLYNFLVYEKKGLDDFSCVVTALTYTCLAGSNTPWYVPIIAMFFAVVVVKMVFGGFANNMFNPAGAAVVLIVIAFTNYASFATPIGIGFARSPIENLANGVVEGFNIVDFFVGDVSASIGSVCATAVLVCALYLLILKVIDYKMPIIAIASYLFFALCLNEFNIDFVLPYLFSGSILFVSFFMLTDYTTSPNTSLGQIIYSMIFGVLSAIFIKINLCGEMGVVVALIIANCFTPLFDRIIRPHYFGEGK